MKRGSTFFLRGVIIFIGIVVFGSCVFTLTLLDDAGYFLPLLLLMNATAIPFFIALYLAMKLLNYIDKNKAFSELSTRGLKKIKYCAVIISALYAISMPYIIYVAERDDAPGAVAIGLVIVFASLVIAVFAALLQKILQNAIDIKSENDLTV